MASTPILVLLAGPNGAGKSTLYRHVLVPLAERFGVDMGPFLNADEYARERWGAVHDPELDYEASQVIAARREDLMSKGESFVTETVFSHRSKLDLVDAAIARGYEVFLEIVIVPADTSVERVALRSSEGGHDVAERKIRDRYVRTDELLAEAIQRVQHARIWLNETYDAADPADRFNHARLARFENGRIVVRKRHPEWMPPHLLRSVTRGRT